MIGNVYQISSVPAKLDISTVKPRLSAGYIKAKLDIQKSDPYIEMHQRNIKLDVDSSACFAEEGHKTARMLMAEYAQQGLQGAQDATHETAVEGQMMVHAGPHENVYKEVAKQQFKGQVADTGIKFIPSVKPTLTWEENDLQMEWHPLKYNCSWTTASWADINLEQKGSVTISEVQKPEFHIQYTGSTNTLYLFHSLDMTV
jgi:hypothetical protein